MDSASWDERYAAADRLWPVGPNMYVEDRLSVHEPGVGVDLASGEGRNAVWLAERGWNMTAVDFSEVAIKRGRQHAADVKFDVADVVSWEPEDSVDLVLIAYLHLEPQTFPEVVQRSSGWVRQGGELFMIGHDVSNIEHGHGGPQSPEILWDVRTIKPLLDHMRIIEGAVLRRPVDTEAGLVYARDALVRATPLG